MHKDFHRQPGDNLVHKVDNSGYYPRKGTDGAGPLFTNCNIPGRAGLWRDKTVDNGYAVIHKQFCPKGRKNMQDESMSISAPEENTIAETGSITAKTARGTVHCITIVGQIEGHMELPAQNKTTKYEHLIPQITAVEQAEEIDGLLVLLNTVGGDVEAGLAIAELIAGMTKPTVSLVLGGGHSIGVPLAVAAKKSFIAASAAMTIHPVRMNGTIIAVPQAFEYLAKIQERIVDFITSHSGISAERLQQLMRETGQLTADVGTVISGRQAVALGLIDEVGTLSDALDALYEMIAARHRASETKK